MNILSVNSTDLGGLSYNLCEAINKLTSHYAINVVDSRTFTLKPVMANRNRRIFLGKGAEFKRNVRHWVENADVIHINEKWGCVSRYGLTKDNCKDKKIVYHTHGSIFRKHSAYLLKEFTRRFPHLKIITSTPDLLAYIPKDRKATWFPSIVPIERYRRTYKIKRNDPPMIYYSPSGSSTKPMKAIIGQVTAQLKREGLKFGLKITTMTHHTTNMELKSKADIYYDEIDPSPFYGVNAIEAGVFGLSVICNMNTYARQYMKKRKCPFLLASDIKTLRIQLRKLIKDKAYRRKVGKVGYRYVKRMHSPKVCLKRFFKLVE